MTQDILIPDIGAFSGVTIVEIPVKPGDRVAIDDPILLLETDKATMDIPSPVAGIVAEVLVSVGDKVSRGDVVMRMRVAEIAPKGQGKPADADDHADLVVIGAGPGGYTAAFRAADLGRSVTLIDARDPLGGVCLNVGCIPSKVLLHAVGLMRQVADAASHGISFGQPQLDLAQLRGFKDDVVARLTGGLAGLARKRKVRVIRGRARFSGPHALAIQTAEGLRALTFDQAIIAAGSSPARLPFLPDDPRIIDSTGALALNEIPGRMLVIGGGIIGLEMAQVYHGLGAQIDIVEMAGQIIPGADPDILAPLARQIKATYAAVMTDARVTGVKAGSSLRVTIARQGEVLTREYDRILVAVGRTPNGANIAADAAGISIEGPGFIAVDAQMRTGRPHIFAIGDIVGQPMLAHKATHEGKIAAEAACGEPAAFEPAAIPAVCYTDPEIAWCGLTEAQARAAGIAVGVGRFPWLASGRSLTLGRNDGLTKLLFDPDSGRVLGGAITGPGAGELIAEIVLAMEMGANAEDLALSIHAHPTLSETAAFAAEDYLGVLTDL